MQPQIESIIFSNVGNRLTQELAMGLVLSIVQAVSQVLQERPPMHLQAGDHTEPAVGGCGVPESVAPDYARETEDSAAAAPVAAPRETGKRAPQ
ncbi:hypothetical protein ACXXNA_05630 [Bordetella bronchiseptica]